MLTPLVSKRSCVLSLGLVLDCGEGVSHVVPVYEGFALPHAVTRSNVAGRDVTDRLQLLLRRGGCTLQTSSERDIVRQIKEDCCRVSFNPRGEGSSGIQEYRLPDGEMVNVGSEAHEAPEVLFQPDLIGSEEAGVQTCLHQSLMRSDRDLRSVLYKHIVLAGGSTLFKGFGDRLLNDLRKVAPDGTKIIISAPPQRKWSTWVGGSILAALNTFNVRVFSHNFSFSSISSAFLFFFLALAHSYFLHLPCISCFCSRCGLRALTTRSTVLDYSRKAPSNRSLAPGINEGDVGVPRLSAATAVPYCGGGPFM